MYESLKIYTNDFHLFIFAFDDISFKILGDMDLKNVTVVSLMEFETPELLEVKKTRTKGEYCWTCTPSILSFLLTKYNFTNCTYIDADLLFYSDPVHLIEEMIENKKNVLITEHRFSSITKLYEQKRAGRFCVQFITFSNQSDSLEVLEKWRLQCLDWCYAKFEDGKFGDQKYLDEWPEKYNNIHILKHLGGGIAPWNIQQYKFKLSENSVMGMAKTTGITFTTVFYHFQSLKFLKNGTYDLGWHRINSLIRKIFYIPYIEKLVEIEDNLSKIDPNYRTSFAISNTGNLKNILKTGLKTIFRYNIIKLIL